MTGYGRRADAIRLGHAGDAGLHDGRMLGKADCEFRRVDAFFCEGRGCYTLKHLRNHPAMRARYLMRSSVVAHGDDCACIDAAYS